MHVNALWLLRGAYNIAIMEKVQSLLADFTLTAIECQSGSLLCKVNE